MIFLKKTKKQKKREKEKKEKKKKKKRKFPRLNLPKVILGLPFSKPKREKKLTIVGAFPLEEQPRVRLLPNCI